MDRFRAGLLYALLPVLGGISAALRCILWAAGALFVSALVLACTRIPFDAHRWLGTAAGECITAPDVIVVLGGSGMPSGPELLRLHRAAEAARQWPRAAIIVVHPGDTAVLNAMVDELLLRGVAKERVESLNHGDNTRAQAMAVSDAIGDHSTALALVTAPENIYRSVRTFQKAGFTNSCGLPAWDHAMHHEFGYAHKAIGGKPYVPDVSRAPGFRYTFWNYLKLEVTCLREYVAIAYYRLNGWL
jgi:uncharacterized SAM-binding protein YcdF (DUF218 family)